MADPPALPPQSGAWRLGFLFRAAGEGGPVPAGWQRFPALLRLRPTRDDSAAEPASIPQKPEGEPP